MARLIRKTAKVSGSEGGRINVRGREWTKEDLRELKNHSREKTPAKTIAKLNETNESSSEATRSSPKLIPEEWQPPDFGSVYGRSFSISALSAASIVRYDA